MAKRSIETTIKLNVLLIYLLVAIVCGGVFLYFYGSRENIHQKKRTFEGYNDGLARINRLIDAVNRAQADVNLYVITERRMYLKQYQERTQAIRLQIDSLKNSYQDLSMDTVWNEITDLLIQKEQSIISLNRQFTNRSPIDTLSQKLSALQNKSSDTLKISTESIRQEPVRKGFWKKVGRLFSSSKAETPETSTAIDTSFIASKDTLPVERIIAQAREDYDQHISAIENKIFSVVLTDQHITSRITTLLTRLYNQLIELRLDEIKEDEAILRKNNVYALVAGGVALLLILLCILLILRSVKRGYAARKALEEANERTRWLMESRHHLLLSVSHDVKTPLNSILGYVDIYRKDGVLSTAEAAPLQHAGSHILALLTNLLEYSSLEKGSVTVNKCGFSLQELCAELYNMFLPLARKKALNFEIRPDFDPDVVLYTDSLKVRQVMTNLLSNAIKYTPQGEVVWTVTYRADMLEFTVADTGVGVPADKQGDLFKPFSRVGENSVLNEGNGFGLFVVKGLVELLQGKIDFRTEVAKGTQVTVKLPVSEGVKSEVSTTGKKILVVDDDDLFLELLERSCQQLGHEVTGCANQHDFLRELAHLAAYDCVLTDMEMVGFSGKDVLKKVRSVRKEVPVILMTGRTDYSSGMILSEGFTDYLPKPVTLRRLHSLVGGELPEQDTSGFLSELFEDDRESMEELLDLFLVSTINHLVLLKEAIDERSFEKVQYLCHKMLPMFIQVKAPESMIGLLQQVDALRGECVIGEELWSEIALLPASIEEFLQFLQSTYSSDDSSMP